MTNLPIYIALPSFLNRCLHTAHLPLCSHIQLVGCLALSKKWNNRNQGDPAQEAFLPGGHTPSNEVSRVVMTRTRVILAVKSSRIVRIEGLPAPVPFRPRVRSRLSNRGNPRKKSPLVGWRAAPKPTPFTVRFFHTTPTCRVFSSSEFALRSRPNIRDISLSTWAHSSPSASWPES